MARVEIAYAVQKPSATVVGGVATLGVSGATVQVNIRGGGPATVFAAETGATTIANPLTSTAEGRIEGWLDEGSYNLVISGAGITGYTQPIDVVRGDGVGRIANSVVTAAHLSPAVLALLVPTGTIMPFAGSAAPTGWLLADGSAVSRTGATAALFGVCGTTYGTGDGSTTFNLPDLRGRIAVGQSAAGHSDVQTLGANEGLTVANRRPKHTHTVASHTHSVPAHFHGRGTLSIPTGGSHSHSDTGHGHTQASHTHVDGANGFLPGQNNQGWGGFFAGYGGSTAVALWWGGTNGVAPAINSGNAQITTNAHAHANSEFSGSVGATGGVSGDAAMTSGSTALTSDVGSAGYIALAHIIKT
jgi:microcystin-dependent protein